MVYSSSIRLKSKFDHETVQSRFPRVPLIVVEVRWPLVNGPKNTLLTVNYPESHCDQRRTHGPRRAMTRDYPRWITATPPVPSSLDCVGRRVCVGTGAMTSTRLSVDLTGHVQAGNSSV
jgi:hypothetical protein